MPTLEAAQILSVIIDRLGVKLRVWIVRFRGRIRLGVRVPLWGMVVLIQCVRSGPGCKPGPLLSGAKNPAWL